MDQLPNRAMAISLPTAEEYRAAYLPAGPFALSGEMPNTSHPDAMKILEICAARSITVQIHPGLALQTCPNNYVDKWFITFHEPDDDHELQWFYEASNSAGHVFRAHEFKDFLEALDSPPTPDVKYRPYSEQQVPRDWTQIGGLAY